MSFGRLNSTIQNKGLYSLAQNMGVWRIQKHSNSFLAIRSCSSSSRNDLEFRKQQMCTSSNETPNNIPTQISGSSLTSRWKRRSLDPASRVGNYMDLSNSAVTEDASIESKNHETTSEISTKDPTDFAAISMSKAFMDKKDSKQSETTVFANALNSKQLIKIGNSKDNKFIYVKFNVVDKFLNCLDDIIAFHENLDPVNPTKISENSLHSKDFLFDGGNQIIFELMENIDQRYLKVSNFHKNTTVVDIPADKMSYLRNLIQNSKEKIPKKNEIPKEKNTTEDSQKNDFIYVQSQKDGIMIKYNSSKIRIGKMGIDQFLTILQENITFLKDLKPVDPDNINEATLLSKEFAYPKDPNSPNDKSLHGLLFQFDLLENASGTRSLKITKKQPDSELVEINIPENKLDIVEKQIQKIANAIAKKKNKESEDKKEPEKTNLEKSNKSKTANDDQIYVNFKNNYFQLRSYTTSGKINTITIGTNAEQFLNCLNDSLTFSKDLKPVDPDNIKEEALYSKEYTSESDTKFSFELMETALTGTRNLKITKKATDSDPFELDIPENKLGYVISEMKKKISLSEKLKNNIKKKENQQAKTASNDNKESVEKPEKNYLRTVLHNNFGLVRLRDKELKLVIVLDPNVSTMEFINNIRDVKTLVQDLKPLDPNNLSNESLYFKELTSYDGDLKYQFDLTEKTTGRILKVTQIWSGENIISIDIPTEELIQYNGVLKAIKKKAKRNSEFVTSNGLNFGLTMHKAAIVLNSISFEANQFSKEFSDVISYCNTLGATSESAEENCYSKEVVTNIEENYRFDLSKNSKGKFLKITRSKPLYQSPVIIPVEALEDINQSIQDLIKKNANDTIAKQENEIPKDGN